MNKQTAVNETISKLSDEALIKEISDKNRLQLSNIGSMAYIELFNRNLYLKSILKENKQLIEELLEEDSKFKQVYKSIESKALNLENIFDIDKLNENLNLEELKNIRKDIVKVLRTLTAYSTEISFTHEIAKDILYKQFIKDNESEIDKTVDQQKLFDAISKFVMEDPTSVQKRIMDLTNVLPMRITKAKYYDMISQAFKRNLNYSSKRQTDVVLARYKTLLNGSLESEYGLYFNRYFMKSQEFRQVEFGKLSDEELNKVYEDSYKVIMEIASAANVIRELGVIVNRLISICILQKEISQEVSNYNIDSLKDVWKAFIQDETQENQAEVLKTYKSIFAVLDSKFRQTNSELQTLTMENFNRKNKINDDLKLEIMKTQYVLEYINDYAIDQEEILETDYQSVVEKEYLDEAVDNLVKFIERNITQMDALQRRMRMRRLLTLTENAFIDPNKFFEYLANSIERTSAKDELIATVNSVLEIITEYRSKGSFDNQ